MEGFHLLIPASTSNIGPGYDTLGLALCMYNRLTVEPGGKGLKFRFASGVRDIFRDKVLAMVERSAKIYLQRAGVAEPSAKITFQNEVPIARGLGSSATFRMGVLSALNHLVGEPLDLESLLSIGCALEKHTENCVASAIGGLTASGFIGDKVVHASFKLAPDFSFIAAIPERTVSTSEMRERVPRRISMKDAVANLNRTALLIHALTEGKTESLAALLDDRFHQPFRARVITPLFEVIKAARDAGACGGFLSGSGSTIIAVAIDRQEEIGLTMKKALDSRGWPSKVHILKPDLQGIRLL